MAQVDIVYWDSDCFLGYLKAEHDKIRECRGTAQKAEQGDLIIATSAITLIEVVRLQKGAVRLPQKDEKKIRDFFDNPYIYLQNVDRQVGFLARQLIWKEGFSQRDSIHVATALVRKIPKLHTFDQALLKRDGKLGNPKLGICHPDIQHQGHLRTLYEEKENQNHAE